MVVAVALCLAFSHPRSRLRPHLLSRWWHSTEVLSVTLPYTTPTSVQSRVVHSAAQLSFRKNLDITSGVVL